MKDVLLSKFFELKRWETAIETGVQKKIDKGDLRKLCTPEVRKALHDAIVLDQYEIAPPHQALIPKDNGDFRTVYVNENIDRIFLSIANDLLFEICGDMIHPSCKSYQKGIGCGKVVQQVSKTICETNGNYIGFKADLSKYFDTVTIETVDEIFDKIENCCGNSKIIRVLRKYYHSDLCFNTDGDLISHYQSLKQGCAVASFLSDVALAHIDSMISSFPGYYVRYSDDLLYVGPHVEEVMDLLKSELDKMQLTLNPKKVEYLTDDKWFKFLGFNIKGDQITLSKSRVKSFQKEVEKRSIKKRTVSATKARNAINRYLYFGDGQYSWATQVLPIINVEKDIDTLNEFVMDCIRACETGKKKIGGLGSIMDKQDYTITRGVGKNVKANKEKTIKDIEGYYSIRCMRNALLTSRDAYNTLVRGM